MSNFQLVTCVPKDLWAASENGTIIIPKYPLGKQHTIGVEWNEEV